MTRMEAVSMLDAFEPNLPATSSVSLLPPRRLVSIAALGGASLDAALGVSLPTTSVRVTHGGTTYLWSGPKAWLAMAETGDLFIELSAAIGPLAALTEQSDGMSLLHVAFPHAIKILPKLVGIDLHPSAFGPDAVALTLAAHIGVRLWREDDGFVLACFRSFAGALYHALVEASASL
jgi:sarcosine oxidase subunit gamma